MWIAGTYFSFSDLIKVRFTTQPLVLHFKVQASDSEGSVNSESMHVLVPRGHDAEAARLQQLYQTEVIEGARQARERLYNPPEPL